MLDRTVAPPFQRTTDFSLIEPQIVTLKNGARIYFLSGGQQDVIKVEIVFRAGRWYEQTWGAAHFASNLLTKGTTSRNSFDIARIFDLYGAHIEISAGLDLVSVSLYTLTKNLKPVFDLLFEILMFPTFPEKELEQSKTIYLQNLKVNQEKTSFQAGKSFRKNVFGDKHPYGKELEENDVINLSREQVRNHFDTFFKDFFIVVSGKISDQTKTLISDEVSSLTNSAVPAVRYDEPIGKPFRIVEEKEGSVQSSVRVGKRFIGRNHPDYFDVLLLNHILGGYFGSRLMKNIREEKGLTYGIYSSIHTLIHDNYLVIGADVNKENVNLTFDEIRSEFHRMRTELIAEDEFQSARNHFIGSLQGEITTPFSHADKIKNIIVYQLPDDYYTRLIRRMDSLSTEDLLRAAQLYYQEDTFYEIAFG